MASLVRATSPVLKLVFFGSFVIAALFVCAGVWFVYLGATGDSTFTLFGQSFRSSNVGIAALFLGAVTVVLLLRRSLKTLDNVVGRCRDDDLYSFEHPRRDLNEWPNVKDLATLRRIIKALSDKQWNILAAVERQDGADRSSLCDGLPADIGMSEMNYRLWGLAKDELVVLANGKVYLAEKVRGLSKGISLGTWRS